ncbi:MAG: DNA recombination protein RmuC [Planctomycetes bacterium]|nr:DNA recombination protein RmuC [Planctomycetota bacterium]
MNEVLPLLAGAACGALVAVVVMAVLGSIRRGALAESNRQLLAETQAERERELATQLEHLKGAFATLSQEALAGNREAFIHLAEAKLETQTRSGVETLESKKKLIDARLEEMGTKLTNLNSLIQTAEKQRAESHGSLTGQLKEITQATDGLRDTTGKLREALASPQRRGQWGERMAEDVLRLAGFVEGLNYRKQQTVAEGGRPDFTFLLPGDRKLHMDVKFPMKNFLEMLGESEDAKRAELAQRFVKDVRARITEVTTRAYINPAEGTLDYVLVFIPIEQTYGFIHEHDRELMDFALQQKVVLCSPLTLYAILAVIRQSVDNFKFEQASSQILELLAEFKRQWEMFTKVMDKMGKRLEEARVAYDDLVGVRTRQLERQLERIDDLRLAHRETAAIGSAAHEE